MTAQNRHTFSSSADGSRDTFLDGDTLVCRLLPGRGLGRQLERTLDHVRGLQFHGLRHVLIDCVDLHTIDPPQLRAFGAVEEELLETGIELLVLDARGAVLARLATWLPGAIWIDSATGARSTAMECPAPKR